MNRLEPIRGYCHRCAAVHLWAPLRGGQALRCEGCGDRFPCRSQSCGHLDCEQARAELATATTDHPGALAR